MFKQTDPFKLPDNFFTCINNGALLTAGDATKFNTMTISWGGVGILWQKPVMTCYVRPQRYTFGFTESHDYYTVSFLEDGHKDTLALCGSKSGRDVDKVAACNLHPVVTDEGVYFEEARLVLVCKKICIDRMNPDGFLDPSIEGFYPINDYHRVYVGEIVKALVKE